MTNEEILRELNRINARLEKLEKDSHPPVDLEAPIRRAIARIMTEAAQRVREE